MVYGKIAVNFEVLLGHHSTLERDFPQLSCNPFLMSLWLLSVPSWVIARNCTATDWFIVAHVSWPFPCWNYPFISLSLCLQVSTNEFNEYIAFSQIVCLPPKCWDAFRIEVAIAQAHFRCIWRIWKSWSTTSSLFSLYVPLITDTQINTIDW